MDQRRINAALDACYDAVVDPASWVEALHGLARSLDAVCCMFYPQHPEDTLLQMPASHDFRDFLGEFVRDGWWLNDHRADRGWPMFNAGRTVVLEEEVATEEERRALAAYHDLYPRYDVPWWAGLGFRVSERQWVFPILRSERAGRFARAEAAQMEPIVPHLRRMISISEKLAFGRVVSTLDILDHVRVAALALDWRSRVIRMNSAAKALLGDGIACVAGRLEATDRRSDGALQRLLAAAVSPEAADLSTQSAATSTLPVTIRRFGRRPLVAEAMPAAGLFGDILQQARALVFIADMEARNQPRQERIAAILGVTAAESLLLARLAAGDGLAEAAAAIGISIHTARSQLKSLFAKTGTHRQAELVALGERIGSLPETR